MISFNDEELILITGASSGIGRATALLCNKLGARVVAIGRNIDSLKSLQSEATKPEHIYLEPCDLVENIESLPSWVTELKNKYGKFSGFVHSAGYTLMQSFRDFNHAESRKMIDLHYHVAMLLARGVTDKRNREKSCSCVFLSAISAVVPVKSLTMYSAAKGALQTAARTMSKELGPHGIRVNCVSPALVRSPMTEDYSNNIMGTDVLEKEDTLYPLGILETEDVANTVVFLLSHASRKITGQNISIDGGRH